MRPRKRGAKVWLIGSLVRGAISVSIAALTSTVNSATAQIVPDASLESESSTVTPQSNNSSVDVISGGATRGDNLFHSFEQFSVVTGREAHFNNASSVQNIITRVTGNSASNIDGLLQANGSANLFLLNPNGIIFGPNAALNIGGSFLASTASSLKLSDGNQFSAKAPQALPLLTINVPIGLQYEGASGNIINQSITSRNGTPIGLQVQPGKTLALVGGNIISDGGVARASGGRVELGGAAGTGTIDLSVDGHDLVLNFPSTTGRADISLLNGSLVDITGVSGDKIQVTGRRITLTNGSKIIANTLGAQTGGSIDINASDSVELSGTTDRQLGSSLLTYNNGTAAGGSLNITTKKLTLRDGAVIAARTFGSGAGGAVNVQATDTVELIGTTPNGQLSSSLYTGTDSTGAGGNLTIATGKLIVRDGANLAAFTFGPGTGGTLSVNATEAIELIGATADEQFASGLFTDTYSVGKASNLAIATGKLTVRDGAVVAARTLESGQGGDLSVSASEKIELIGTTPNSLLSSSLSTDTVGSGAGGNLTIATGKLIVRDGANVAARTFGLGQGGTLKVNAAKTIELAGTAPNGQFVSGLFTDTRGAGSGGDLTITTGNLTASNQALVAARTYAQGDAGNVTIRASNTVSLSGIDSGVASAVARSSVGEGGDIDIGARSLFLTQGARVTSSTLGAGKAGNIQVNAPDVNLTNGAALGSDTGGIAQAGNLSITASKLTVRDGAGVVAGTYGQGQGGTINVTASESVELSGTTPDGLFSTGIFATGVSSGENSGNAGNLKLVTENLTIQNNAALGVSNFGSGNAGDIEVTANSISLDSGATIQAETASGQGGNIKLEAQDFLLLSNNDLISATAGTAGAGGDGGNITINSPFIIAVPNGNSDITANAFSGNGGRVAVTAQGIFGLQLRSRQNLQTSLETNNPTELDPRRLSSNDITAISQTNPSVSGLVTFNAPDVDPIQGVVELPVELVDASNQIASSCAARGGNNFVVTGNGGLPPNPREALDGEATLSHWAALRPNVAERSSNAPTTNTISNTPNQIVEAQGWVVNKQREVVLRAIAPAVLPHIQGFLPATCRY